MAGFVVALAAGYLLAYAVFERFAAVLATEAVIGGFGLLVLPLKRVRTPSPEPDCTLERRKRRVSCAVCTDDDHRHIELCESCLRTMAEAAHRQPVACPGWTWSPEAMRAGRSMMWMHRGDSPDDAARAIGLAMLEVDGLAMFASWGMQPRR